MQATSFEARARQSKADAVARRKLQQNRRKAAISDDLYETRVAIQTTLAGIEASNSLIRQILPLAFSSSMDTETLAPPYFANPAAKRARTDRGVHG